MPSMELFLAFLAAAAVFAYMPGPALLYTAAQTIARGRRAGLMAALGIHLGGYVHVFAAAAGLSVLFHAVPLLYLILKLAGAAYLVWLGICMFRAPPAGSPALSLIEPKSARRAFVESMTVEVLNPKVAVFFLAFLPQFIDPSAPLAIWAQFLVLGSIVNIMFSSADLVCVALAGAIVERMRSSDRMQRITKRIGGGLLIGLGAHLALQRS